MKKKTLLATGAILLMLNGGAYAETPLSGSWLLQTWETDEGTIDAQRGLWIFTNDHYSIMFINTPEDRPGYEGDETDEHRVMAYNGFTANSGRYEVDGNMLKTRAVVSKDTNYMAGWPENEVTYEFEVDGDSLTITSVTFAQPFKATFRQVENTPNPWESD